MRLPAEENESEGPNLTPVIDVVFLLLIFFLVATRFDQEERELSPTLPDVVEAEPLTMPPRELVVNITPDGKYVVLKKEYDEKQLQSLLDQAGLENPSTQSVLIRGDSEVAWKLGVQVMGMCKRAEIKDFRVAVTQRK